VFESHWQEVAERVWPDRALFTTQNVTGGAKRSEKQFDATAALALTRFAAAMESMLTPRTGRWHKLRVSDDKINDIPAVQRYLDEVTDLLFRTRYSSRANFASQMHENYMSIGAFGSGGVFVDDMLGRGIRYKSLDLGRMYFSENRFGVIDTVHRAFKYTARQALQHFAYDKLPAKIKTSYEKNPDEQFEFLHCVKPREDVSAAYKMPRDMPLVSYYVCVDTKDIVEDGGYYTMPYSIGRYITSPMEVYGRSPAMMVLSNIKMLDEMQKTTIRAAHLSVSPPLLLQEDGALQAFDLRPNALNYGGVDINGAPLVHPLDIKAKINIGLEMIQDQQRIINDAFLVTLFQILVDQPNMTATEAMLRAQEKGALLAPTMGRQQSEMLGPMIERELDILARAGALPEMPRELMDAGGIVDVEYVSPLNRVQRADEGVAIMRTAEAAGIIGQFDQRALKAYDWLEAVREIGEINGVPAKLRLSDEQLAEGAEQEQAMAQLGTLLNAAPVAAQTAKTFAETQQIASQGAPAIMQ
jgi:hypothetical protein